MKHVSRRVLLKNGGLALACVGGVAGGWGPSFLRHAAIAAAAAGGASPGKGKVLICLFQRGAADGLSMAVPYGDPHYRKLRDAIALPDPSRAAGGEASLDLDGFFAFHRVLAPLLPAYRKGELAVIHACGSPNATRSHFDAQDFMEAGVADDKSTDTGWLHRALRASPAPARRTPLRAVSITPAVPRSLTGETDVLAVPDLAHFGVNGARTGGGAAGGFEGLFDEAADATLRDAGRDSFEAIRLLASVRPGSYRPANGAAYGADPFGRALMQIAQLVKADVGLQVAFAESGGWDTHANQGAASGQLAGHLTDFARGIAALHADLGDRMDDVVILTMTEFGRSVRQNGNRGTDHGHGACFLALGGNVNGGKVLGKWPGLAPEQLFEGRDLAVTTDYRDVLAEIAHRHLGATDLRGVFPGFEVKQENRAGLLKA